MNGKIYEVLCHLIFQPFKIKFYKSILPLFFALFLIKHISSIFVNISGYCITTVIDFIDIR